MNNVQRSTAGDAMSRETKEQSTGDVNDFGLGRRQMGLPEASSFIGRERKPENRQSADIKDWYRIYHSSEGIERPKVMARRRTQLGGTSRLIIEGDAKDRTVPPTLKKFKGDILPSFQPSRRKTSHVFKEQRPPSVEIDTEILAKKGWTTADAIRDDQEAFIIYAVRDFILFIIFMSIISVVLYGPNVQSINYFSMVISEVLFKSNFTSQIGDFKITSNLYQMHSIGQIWSYIHQVIMIKSLFYSTVSENVHVGVTEIRQIRVKNNTCYTAPMFQDLYVTCYDYYTEGNEDIEPFGDTNSTVWRYTPLIHRSFSTGQVGSYGGGGYQFNLTDDPTMNKIWLNELEDQSWMRLGTRAVITDATIYTPNANTFLFIKVIFEILPTGGIVATPKLTMLKLFRYVAPWDLIVMGCEIAFTIYALYYGFEELQQMWILREEYLANGWNILDIMILCISYTLIFFGFRRLYVTRRDLRSGLESIHTHFHVDFDNIIEAELAFRTTGCFLIFVIWLKLFKFSALYKSVTLILSALGKITGEMLMLLLMSFILLTGFAIFGMCLFGAHVQHFQSYLNALMSLIFVYAGSLDFYDECKKVYPTLAPIYFSVYILLIAVIFFAFYVVLIVHGYDCAHVSMQQRPESLFFSDLLLGFFMEILVRLRQSSFIKKIQMRLVVSQNKEDYDAFVEVLKRQGWRKLDDQLLLKSFGIERGEEMKLDKMSEVYNSFWLKNMLSIEVEGHNDINDRLDKIDKMFEFCDQALIDVMAKVDYLSDSFLSRKQKTGSRS